MYCIPLGTKIHPYRKKKPEGSLLLLLLLLKKKRGGGGRIAEKPNQLIFPENILGLRRETSEADQDPELFGQWRELNARCHIPPPRVGPGPHLQSLSGWCPNLNPKTKKTRCAPERGCKTAAAFQDLPPLCSEPSLDIPLDQQPSKACHGR